MLNQVVILMTKDDELEYANKYKKTAKKLGVVISIFIIIFGILIIGLGIFLACYNRTVIIIVFGSIMGVAGILDIILALKFKKFTDRRLEKISNKEACYRYCKIHGFKKD